MNLADRDTLLVAGTTPIIGDNFVIQQPKEILQSIENSTYDNCIGETLCPIPLVCP